MANDMLTDTPDMNSLTLDDQVSNESQTRVFRMGSGRFAMELIFRYSWIWMLGLSVLSVAGIVLGITVNLRWLVVGLLVICVVIPMVLAFLYYYYGLQRGCFVNTIPHRIVVSEDGLIARLVIRDSEAPEEVRVRDEFFPFNRMRPFVVGNDSAVIPLKSPAKGFIWIPADAFNDENHLSDLLKTLDSKIEK